MLIGEALNQDAQIKQGLDHLVHLVSVYQKQLVTIKPPNPEHEASYLSTLKVFENQRGASLWFPYLGSGAGNGALVELMDGSVKYDLISGIGAHWGHSHPKLIEANLRAALSDIVMQGNLQQNKETAELSNLLVQASGIDHVFLTSSGAMACENALKLIFQKKAPACRLLAFEHCFAGRTTTLCQITDKASYREGIPLNLQVDYLPFYDPLHHHESIEKAVTRLKNYLERYPHQYAAICAELIQGEGGFNLGHRDFFTALFDLLREHGVAIFIDEIQTFGRTPSLFAFHYFGLAPYADVVTIGKISQVCATLFSSHFKPSPGLLSQTFTSSTSAIYSSLSIIKSLLYDDFLGADGKIAQLHHYFVRHLEEIAKRHPTLIKGPWGIGTMICFTPLDGSKKRVTKFLHQLYHAGLIGFLAGENPTKVRFLLPAGALSFQDIDRVSQLIEETLTKTQEIE